jgi:hypothetical protein
MSQFIVFMKSFITALLLVTTFTQAEEGWISLFNGKDLTGWKSNEENPGAFEVKDGVLHVQGGRAHLFYVGADGAAKFKNFELKAKVKLGSTEKGSNSGIFFHTEYQPTGWPEKGYECQVNSTKHKDPKKTGGLYAVKDVMDTSPVEDEVWFDYHIKVQGNHITISINGQVTSDFVEPADWDPSKTLKNMPGRRIAEGTIAIQGHDPISRVQYKDISIKVLP